LIQTSHSEDKTAASRTRHVRPGQFDIPPGRGKAVQRASATEPHAYQKTTKGHAHEKHHPRQAQADPTETGNRDSTRHRDSRLFRGSKAAADKIEEKKTEQEKGCEQWEKLESLVTRHVLHNQSHTQQERGDELIPLDDFARPGTQHAYL
jgi:hypothetical protein